MALSFNPRTGEADRQAPWGVRGSLCFIVRPFLKHTNTASAWWLTSQSQCGFECLRLMNCDREGACSKLCLCVCVACHVDPGSHIWGHHHSAGQVLPGPPPLPCVIARVCEVPVCLLGCAALGHHSVGTGSVLVYPVGGDVLNSVDPAPLLPSVW